MIDPVDRNMNDFLEVQLTKMRKLSEYWEAHNPAVSSVHVGWHLVHALKVITRVCQILEKSDPRDYKSGMNLFRSRVFLSGSLHRGRGHAPRSTQPDGEVTQREILEGLGEAKTAIIHLEELPAGANFYHGALGQLDLEQTKRFLEIHTQHHLEIIKDILEQ